MAMGFAVIFAAGAVLRENQYCRAERRRANQPAIAASPTNGFVRRSCAKLLCGPWPGKKTVSSPRGQSFRSEEHTSELQSLMRISYAVFCLKKKKYTTQYVYTGKL